VEGIIVNVASCFIKKMQLGGTGYRLWLKSPHPVRLSLEYRQGKSKWIKDKIMGNIQQGD
jgi:ribosomal protein L6P/L9E